jgi:hypothetical protein
VEDLPGLGSAQSVHPPVVRVSGRAQAELRTGEALVVVWTRLAFCRAVAGEARMPPDGDRRSRSAPSNSGKQLAVAVQQQQAGGYRGR